MTADVVGSQASHTTSNALLCSITSRLSDFESLLRHQHQHVIIPLKKSNCHKLTSMLRYDFICLTKCYCYYYYTFYYFMF